MRKGSLLGARGTLRAEHPLFDAKKRWCPRKSIGREAILDCCTKLQQSGTPGMPLAPGKDDFFIKELKLQSTEK